MVYGEIDARDRTPEVQRARIHTRIAEVLKRQNVTGWLRLQDIESTITVRSGRGRTSPTDGPFVESKDFLGGFIVVEAKNLDEALTVAGELQDIRGTGAIEVRPVREDELAGD